MQQQRGPEQCRKTRQTITHQAAQLIGRRRCRNVQTPQLDQLASQLILGLMAQVCIRQFYKLERVMTVKHDARVSHLMKLDWEYVSRVREFFNSEINRQRMAQALPLTHRRLGLAQVFRRDLRS